MSWRSNNYSFAEISIKKGKKEFQNILVNKFTQILNPRPLRIVGVAKWRHTRKHLSVRPLTSGGRNEQSLCIGDLGRLCPYVLWLCFFFFFPPVLLPVHDSEHPPDDDSSHGEQHRTLSEYGFRQCGGRGGGKVPNWDKFKVALQLQKSRRCQSAKIS